MSEHKYKHIIEKFINNHSSVDQFIDSFFNQWKEDRDRSSEIFDPKFGRIIDRIFTSCDCYAENPEGTFEITEQELRDEVKLLAHIWWG